MFYKGMIPTWMYHHSEFLRAIVFGHTYDRALMLSQFGHPNTIFPSTLKQLDEEVKAAMYTMQQSEGQQVQVALFSKRSFGNYGQSGPMQAWDVTFHCDSVVEACVKVGEFLGLLSHHKPFHGVQLCLHPV